MYKYKSKRGYSLACSSGAGSLCRESKLKGIVNVLKSPRAILREIPPCINFVSGGNLFY